MKFRPYLPWFLALCFVVIDHFASRPISASDAVTGTLRVKALEIVDNAGKSRISMRVQSDGRAILSFNGAIPALNSSLVQKRDGGMRLEFAGPGQEPSVVLDSDLHFGGPRFTLKGYTWSEQNILLGYDQGDVPTDTSRVWGLFLRNGFNTYGSLVAARDPKTGVVRAGVVTSEH
jgi:hypothetical protein